MWFWRFVLLLMYQTIACFLPHKTADNWQMTNLHKSLPNATLQKLHDELHQWYNCHGESCP